MYLWSVTQQVFNLIVQAIHSCINKSIQNELSLPF